MHPTTILRLDRGFGPPLCAVLTLWRRLVDRLAPATARPMQRIVFLKMVEQGATVLAYPAIQRAVQRLGRENVFFWVFQENREIVDILDLLPRENVIALRSRRPWTLLVDLLRSFRRLRQERVDTVIDMEFFSRSSALFAYLSGARTRVGLHRFTAELPYRGDLFTHRVQYNPHLHTAQLYALLFDAVSAAPEDTPLLKAPPPPEGLPMPVFRPSPDEVAQIRELLRREAGRAVTSPLILLNPNASDLVPLRRWAPERMIDLGQRVLKEWPDATVGITGAPGEAPQAAAIAAAIGPADRVLCLAGKTTLRQLLVLYTVADVLVTNDSGPGHFASMTGVDAIILFGPETPRLWKPLGPCVHIVWSGLACSPCVNPFNHRFSPCRNNRCMQAVSVDQVWMALRQAREQRAART